ncbi:hypothetical protein Tco_0617357 [Tanacetum coccineum]
MLKQYTQTYTQNCMEDPEQAFVEYASFLSPDLGFYMWYQSLVALDLGLIRSASLRMITAAGGRSYQENSRFLEMYSSISLLTESEYMSAYSFVLVTLGNSYWSLGSCWFHHVPANGCLLGYYWSYDGSSWCLYGSYWLYILIHTGGYELLLVISFLLIGFMVPTGLLMVSSACLFDTICYRC